MKERMINKNLNLTVEQKEKIEDLSLKTGKSENLLIREGIDLILKKYLKEHKERDLLKTRSEAVRHKAKGSSEDSGLLLSLRRKIRKRVTLEEARKALAAIKGNLSETVISLREDRC